MQLEDPVLTPGHGRTTWKPLCVSSTETVKQGDFKDKTLTQKIGETLTGVWNKRRFWTERNAEWLEQKAKSKTGEMVI